MNKNKSTYIKIIYRTQSLSKRSITIRQDEIERYAFRLDKTIRRRQQAHGYF